MKKPWCILIFFMIFSRAFAQTPAIRHYTPRKDGMPQIQVMNIRIAPDGALWVCTYGGVGRFNGKRFTNYRVRNGLISNVVSDVLNASDTTWIATRDGINYLVNDTIKLYLNAPSKKFYSVKFYKHKKLFYLYQVWPKPADSQYFIWSSCLINLRKLKYIHHITYNNSPLHIISSGFPHNDSLLTLSNRYLVNASLKTFKSRAVMKVNPANQNSLLVGTGDALFESSKKNNAPLNKMVQFIPTQHGLKELNLTIKKHSEIKGVSQYSSMGPGKFLFCGSDNKLYRLRSGNISYITSFNDIVNRILYRKHEAWIGTDNGLWKLNIGGFLYYTPKEGFPPYVWSVLSDNSGNMWFATYSSGLYEIKKHIVKRVYYHPPTMFYNGAVKGFQSDLFFPNYLGVTVVDPVKMKFRKINTNEPSLTLQRDKQRKLILIGGLTHLMSVDTNYQVHILMKTTNVGLNYSILSILVHNQKYLLGLARGMAQYNPETGKSRKILGYNIRVSDLVADSTGAVWAATSRGLMRFVHDSLKPVFPNFIKENILTLTVSNDQRLFIAGSASLYTLDLRRYYNHKPHCMLCYRTSAGYNTGEPGQNSFYKDKQGNLWLPTTENVVKINPSKIPVPDHLPVTRLVSGVATNAQHTDTIFITKNTKSITIPYKFNNLRLEYEAVELNFPESLRFQYYLKGESDHWLNLPDETNLVFGNLSPGRYTLKVRASISESFKNVPESIIKIRILPPLWLTWWFISIALAAAAFSIYLTVRFFLKREKIKSEKEMELGRLRSQALGIQMDNHFLANCTAKIASLGQDGFFEDAIIYANHFVRFLQRNLHSLREEWITLQEELDMVEAYINLEQGTRNKFDYILKINPKIDTSKVKVPPLLIQPVIENAIRHGIRQRDEEGGMLKVVVTSADSCLVIEIIDNGPGMHQIIRKGHRVSMKIVEDRLRLMGRASRLEMKDLNPGFKTVLYICSK